MNIAATVVCKHAMFLRSVLETCIIMPKIAKYNKNLTLHRPHKYSQGGRNSDVFIKVSKQCCVLELELDDDGREAAAYCPMLFASRTCPVRFYSSTDFPFSVIEYLVLRLYVHHFTFLSQYSAATSIESVQVWSWFRSSCRLSASWEPVIFAHTHIIVSHANNLIEFFIQSGRSFT